MGKLISRALPGDWTPHKIRHRYATVAYGHSYDLRAVQELLGHASVSTTQIYTAVSDTSMRSAASAAWKIAA
ncbi:tyrosine-type recombinase/integrase [Corynebacterium ulcerans]|uniref:tyrosine-type recombinase/integrase n=1 Tax=Corynebacterium ulcerans TaxID=65058 RepID=UPI000214171D|nr:tyrosine-type recombinase/integrase [Corynebacterium ulcerans]AEG84519.1 Tyrosine recombinase xerD [Corynebacterium ulcerans BR-AD22]